MMWLESLPSLKSKLQEAGTTAIEKSLSGCKKSSASVNCLALYQGKWFNSDCCKCTLAFQMLRALNIFQKLVTISQNNTSIESEMSKFIVDIFFV